jgi:hypothetical protein
MDDSVLDRKEAVKHGRIPPAGSGVAAHPSHLSLEDVHSSVEVPHPQAGFWEQWRPSSGRRFSSTSATWTLATGGQIYKLALSLRTALVGGWRSQPDGPPSCR